MNPYQATGAPGRLQELGEQLAELTRRVRAAVAEVVGQTLARLLRDAVDQLLLAQRHRPAFPRSWDEAPDPFDPWADDPEEAPWSEPPSFGTPEAGRVPFPWPRRLGPALGILIGVGGLAWVLHQRGWPWSILGAGWLLVSWWGARRAGSGLAATVGDLCALDRVLQAAATLLIARS